MSTFDMFEVFSDLVSTKVSEQYQFHITVIGFHIDRTKPTIKCKSSRFKHSKLCAGGDVLGS
jgi:hypothetical protein